MGRTKDLVEYGIDYAHFISLYCRGPLPADTVKNYGEKIEKTGKGVARGIENMRELSKVEHKQCVLKCTSGTN
jgi:hypothetical protein